MDSSAQETTENQILTSTEATDGFMDKLGKQMPLLSMLAVNAPDAFMALAGGNNLLAVAYGLMAVLHMSGPRLHDSIK